MAHFKRKRCRYKGKGRQTSTLQYRVKLGLKPVKIPDNPDYRAGGYKSWLRWRLSEHYFEWKRWHDSMWPIWWPARYQMISGTWPKWHDILYHNRPRRSREKRIEKAILAGRLDPIEAIWPVEKKPHIFYW